MRYYEDFSKWLDNHLGGELPSNVIAINFNIYEGSDDTYDIQMIGSDEFDEEDQDWACSEVFSTEEDIFHIVRTEEIEEWQDGLNLIKHIVEKYIDEGKFANKLKMYKAIAIGFVDGDLEIIYKKS